MANTTVCTPETAKFFNIYDTEVEGVNCPIYSAFFGVMGASAAMVFSGECKSAPNRSIALL